MFPTPFLESFGFLLSGMSNPRVTITLGYSGQVLHLRVFFLSFSYFTYCLIGVIYGKKREEQNLGFGIFLVVFSLICDFEPLNLNMGMN